eukprot:scaffold34284_cov56-Cyclotella_meneghiniana.AAC.1
MLECMSVTSKPMRLKGHLHICSVVECSTLNAKSKAKGRCLGSCTSGRIRFKITTIASLMQLLAAVLWLSVHPRQWSPYGSNFAEHVQDVVLEKFAYVKGCPFAY